MRRPSCFLRPVLLALPLVGCAVQEPEPYEQRLARFMQPFDDLRAQKADLWRIGQEPQEFVFEDHGKVTVQRWELSGWPGEVYVQARVTYENTTDRPMVHALVWLDVLDSKDQPVGSTAIRLMNPMGYPFWPGHTYTTTVRATTNGAHLDKDGWSWTVACEAMPDENPGVKPVLVDHDAERGRWYAAHRAIARRVYAGPHVPGFTRW